MRKFGYFLLIMTFSLVACQPTSQNAELPTLVQFPTETPTEEASLTPTETLTPLPTDTAIPTEIPSDTPEPTNTPEPTATPVSTDTPNPTQVVRGTSTAILLEAPVFSTFTPVPPGAIAVLARPTSTGTPEVLADVIITEDQFQEEVSRLIATKPAISRARVSFVPDGVEYNLTADSDGIFITGTITVPFDYSGGSINNIVAIGGAIEIVIADAEEDEEIPPSFLANVSELVLITQESFNFILNQRLGEGRHDLENIVIVDGRMLISLVVPLPSN